MGLGKVISRGEIVGKSVYTPSAKYVGRVKDIGFIVGGEGDEGKICIIVETRTRSTMEIPVSKIKAFGDIILLSGDVEIPEVPSVPEIPELEIEYEIPRCPKCGSAVVYVPQNKKFYCYNCRKYISLPKDLLEKIPKCPNCGNPLSYIEQYGGWYCYKCKKYVSL